MPFWAEYAGRCRDFPCFVRRPIEDPPFETSGALSPFLACLLELHFQRNRKFGGRDHHAFHQMPYFGDFLAGSSHP